MMNKKGELTLAMVLIVLVFTLAIGALIEPAFTGRVTEESRKGKK